MKLNKMKMPLVVKSQGSNPLDAHTLEGKLLNDTLIVNEILNLLLTKLLEK